MTTSNHATAAPGPVATSIGITTSPLTVVDQCPLFDGRDGSDVGDIARLADVLRLFDQNGGDCTNE